jgi:ABC-type multidrug transport system fused ATPase/permease subunit
MPNIILNKRIFFKIFINKYTIFSMVFLFIQQLIIASSMLWIYRLSASVVEHKNIMCYFLLFGLSLILVCIPVSISAYFLEKSKRLSFSSYIDSFSRKYYLLSCHRNNKLLKEDVEPWVVNEANMLIEECHKFFHDALSITLNNCLNVIVLFTFIGPNLIYGYLFVFIFVLISFRLFKTKIRENALSLQRSRKKLTEHLMYAWDNIIIGNQYNYNIWRNLFKQMWSSWRDTSLLSVVLSNLASAFCTILSTIPVVLNVGYLIYLNINNTVYLAGLVATLPRQIQILQHFYFFSHYLVKWQDLKPKLSNLFQAVNPEIMPVNIEDKINWQAISISMHGGPRGVNSLGAFMELLGVLNSGRIQIQGSNGAGKSTILYAIKEKLGDGAYLLPTHATLIYEHHTQMSHASSGESTVLKLKELSALCSNSKAPSVLLLDEWDANLDRLNKATMHDMLEKLSARLVVIEVRHNVA